MAKMHIDEKSIDKLDCLLFELDNYHCEDEETIQDQIEREKRLNEYTRGIEA